MRRLGVVLALIVALPGVALAQMDSREGIALQNQILQLRQEIEALRRGGVAVAPTPSRPSSGGGGSSEIVQSLLDRVQRMEEEVRAIRGRAEQAEFAQRQLRERVEKLEGDVDFRLQQVEGQRGGGTPAVPPRGAPPPPPPVAPPSQPAANAPRTPQQALAAGQAALGRREFQAAEAAAREVIASRDAPRQVDAQILLGDALMGRRDFSAAAIAYDDARRRSPQGSRAPEATVGIANAFIGLNNNRDACTLLNELRSASPNLAGAVAERATDARRRAQCR
ncbi:tetratricopeptide repeat protein [Falsiroseomonas sp. HW251]|uniref:tetratricopeptide repeat protein n=1 Tax=Falsiroseomonas sp. HW251 TaxID=3390998 RepID=UPI003D315291